MSTGVSYTPLVLLYLWLLQALKPQCSWTWLQVYSPTLSSFRRPEGHQGPAVLSEAESLRGFTLGNWKCPDTNSFQLNLVFPAQTPHLGWLFSAYTNLTSGSWPHLHCLKRKGFWKKTAAMIFFHVFQPGVLKPRAIPGHDHHQESPEKRYVKMPIFFPTLLTK